MNICTIIYWFCMGVNVIALIFINCLFWKNNKIIIGQQKELNDQIRRYKEMSRQYHDMCVQKETQQYWIILNSRLKMYSYWTQPLDYNNKSFTNYINRFKQYTGADTWNVEITRCNSEAEFESYKRIQLAEYEFISMDPIQTICGGPSEVGFGCSNRSQIIREYYE